MEETNQAYHRVLSFGGIRMFAKTNWDSKLWLSWQIFNFIISLLTFLFTGGFVIINLSDIVVSIKSACIWTSSIIMLISYGVCLVFHKRFRQFQEEMGFKDAMLDMPFIEYVLKLEQVGRLNELKWKVLESQEKFLKLSRVMLRTYVFFTLACMTMYLSDSVITMFTTDDDSLRLLGFEMWIPWSLQNFNVYLATYAFNVYCACLCCIAFPSFQLPLFLLVGQIIRQLRILTFILQHLDDLALDIVGQRDHRWQAYYTSILLQSVNYYIKLKRFSNKLNMICRPFYLVLILDAIVLVSLCSVKIAISDKTSPDTMKYYLHASVFIVYVLLFCILGQQVDNECEKLETAVTEKWYIFDRTHKVHVCIFKMALSQRMPIYIFGTVTLSATTFTWFLKTIMSFFTLVMSVLEEN